MNNLILSPIPLHEMENLISNAIKNAFEKYGKTQPVKGNDSKFGDIEWFRLNHPRHLTKSTIYCRISNGKIPKCLIFKPEGTKNVLFYKDRVLDWINQGFPKDYQPRNEE